MRWLLPTFLLLCLSWATQVRAQMVQIEADYHSQFETDQGETVREWYQNVKLVMEGRTLTCDTMRSYETQDLFKFFGHAAMRDSSGMTLRADTIFYYKVPQLFQARYNVVARDENSTLRTNRLDYHRSTEVMEYFGGGTLRDDTTQLYSQYGRYGRNSQIAFFKDSVQLKGESYTLTTDSLRYNLQTKNAFFKSRTRIESEDGTVLSDEGQYNTRTKQAQLYRRSTVETPKYFITANQLRYNRQRQTAHARGDVVLENKADTTLIYGDESFYREADGKAKVWGRVLVKQKAQQDTLYLQADTLLALGTTDSLKAQGKSQKERMIAWPKARFIYQNLSGRCDSLEYQSADSVLFMFGDPLVWTEKSQMSGDTITAHFRNEALDQIRLRTEAFSASEDSMGHLNQVEGRNMTAFFENDTLDRVHVIGNGRSIYFALEGDTALLGMNRVLCSNMILRMDSSGKKIRKINFIRQPDARFVPPHEIVEPDTRLPGFIWVPEQRPQLAELLQVRQPTEKPTDSIFESTGKRPLNPAHSQTPSENIEEKPDPAPEAPTPTPKQEKAPKPTPEEPSKHKPEAKEEAKPEEEETEKKSFFRRIFPKKNRED